MPKRIIVPPQLAGSPFTTAEGLAGGLSADRLRAADLRTPFHGSKAAGLDFAIARDRARAYAPRMTRLEAFSHCTAAQLLGIPLPLRFELDTVLHVSVPPPKHAPRTTGVRGHQRRTGFMPIMRDRLRIASPADTWCDLGEQLTVPDLIAAGDFIVTGNPYAKILPLATLEELELALRRRDGARGSTACRRALPDICDGPLSRPETLLRLLLRDARLPTPQVNLSVHDDRGSFLALPDLAWPEYKFVVEYEGDHHRRIAQFRDDIRRVERLVDYDWVVMKVSADDVFDRSRELVERVVRRLARRGWVPRGIRLPQNGKYER